MYLEEGNLSTEGAWKWDLTANKWFLSTSWLDIHGFIEAPMDLQEFYLIIHPDDVKRVKEELEHVLAVGGGYDIEYRIYRRQSTDVRYLRGLGEVAVDLVGRPIVLVGAVMDVTASKQTQEALKKAGERALTSKRIKSEFLANMSHEIRTPLNGIMGMLQLIQTTGLDNEQLEYIELAYKAAENLKMLLNGILELSMMEFGKDNVIEIEFNLNEVIKSIEDIFSHISKNNTNSLSFICDSNIPEKLIGDKQRLMQILFNIMGNANKFTQKGEIILQAFLIPTTQEKVCRVLFIISDTGEGISEERMESILAGSPHNNISCVNYRIGYEGSGLGLPLVKRLVELIKGNACIESQKGQGTSVYVSLPFNLP